MVVAVSIRQATPDDADALAELHMRSAGAGFTNIFALSDLAVSREEMSADWRGRLQHDARLGRSTLIAEVGEQMVGVLIAGPDPHDPTVGRVSRLYIDPRNWSQGVAGQLLAACITHLRELRCKVATAWIMEPNQRAQAVVERLGARRTGARQPTCEKATSVPAGVEDVEYELLLNSEV
jgi:RimJ/RimL family protein N-acetyltransferase